MGKEDKQKIEAGQGIEKREISEELRESYLDYAMSVIVARALPDVRDGLKPVQRRILWTAWEDGVTHNAKFRKSANIVGTVLGRYHPHGDTAVYDAMARMAQDFALRYPLIDGQGNWGCFTGDTKVALADGRNISFKELIKEFKNGKKNYTYTFNHETKGIEIGEIKNPRLTRKESPLLMVILDSGEKIRCTPNHKFMLRDGSYREAQFLNKGDSLMPGYTRFSAKEDDSNAIGYAMIHQPIFQKWDWVHRLADKWNIEEKVYDRKAGRVRHHKDFNKLNNNPHNIIRMDWKAHWRLHCETSSWRHKNDPEYVKKLKEGRALFIKDNLSLFSERAKKLNKKLWSSEIFRKDHKKRMEKLWSNPEYKELMRIASRERLKEKWQDPAFQKMMSELKSAELKARWQNEEYRKFWTEKTKEISNRLWRDEGHRRRMKEMAEARSSNPEWRERQGRIAKELWQNPEYRGKFPVSHFREAAKKLWSRPSTREFHSEKARKQWRDKEFRAAMIDLQRRRGIMLARKNPMYFEIMAGKAARVLRDKWQSHAYKKRVIRSKVSGYVHGLLKKYQKVTPQIYEGNRENNGVPEFKNALKYFENFKEIKKEAAVYNHSVAKVELLNKSEDVFDLTIEKTHNFLLSAGVFVHNSIDGDSPAAMRYTESRLSRIAEELLEDIDKETVDFQPNYDGMREEPKVLPAKTPNLLLNGTVGIAVGMATNIPPHNLGELMDAIGFLIDNPKAATEDLMAYVHGPDFPTGGVIFNQKGIIEAYTSGRGPITCRAVAEIEERKTGQFNIIVTEIPYQVNKAELVQKIAELAQDKKIEGIRDLRDESSDREGMRIVIELKSDAAPQKILNQLYKHTDLQKDFHLNMIALVDGIVPRLLSLKDVLAAYVEHRYLVIERRAKFDLKKAKERVHILEGLVLALGVIDKIIATIKKSKDRDDARENLMKNFKLTEIQANAILDMRLQSLAALERQKLEDELKEKLKFIKELEILLKSPQKILGVIKDDLGELRKAYGDSRKTKVQKSGLAEFREEDLVAQEEAVIILSAGGYIKRMPPANVRSQKRGGSGLIGQETGDEDFARHFLSADTHDNILFFTNKGRVFQTKVYEIPQGSRVSKGKLIQNFLDIPAGENITAIVSYPNERQGIRDKRQEANDGAGYLVMATIKGIIKKTSLSDFSNVRRSGIIAISLKNGDALQWVRLASGNDDIVLATSRGQAIRFKEAKLRAMGRGASGVRAIRLKSGDYVAGMEIVESGSAKLLVVTEKGFSKQTPLKEYKVQSRGGSGIKTSKVTAKTGKVVGAKVVTAEEELLALSEKGQIIKTKISDIRVAGRATSGVKIMRLKEGDKIAGVVVL